MPAWPAKATGIFHHPGSFTVDLPAGEAEMTIVRGFETAPVTLTAEIRPGETNAITITLDEISDLSDEGWFSGSTHVHMNYAGNLRNSLANLMMMSAAEDQDVVAEQVANKGQPASSTTSTGSPAGARIPFRSRTACLSSGRSTARPSMDTSSCSATGST